jgi:hypothetical protein
MTEARLDDLRRRLYRADATDDDLRRYLDERRAEPEAPPSPERTGTRRTPRRLVLGVALAAVLAVGTAIAVSGRVAGSLEEAAPSSSPLAARNGFGDGLARAVEGPTAVAVSIDGTAAVGQRYQGYGDATVAFTAPAGSGDGGRALVDVTSSEPSVVEWQARLRVAPGSGSTYAYVLANGSAQDRSGAHAPTTFTYASRPLTHLVVSAPSGVGWTLVVAVTPRIAPELR